MERCYNFKDLYMNEKGAYGLRNSYCLPILSLCAEYLDSRDILILRENLLELSSEEIKMKYNLCEEDIEFIYRKYLLDGIKKGVNEMNFVSISPLLSKSLFEEYGVSGKILIRARDSGKIPELQHQFNKSLVSLGVTVSPYYDGDDLTNKISNICGEYKLPVFVTLYDDLEQTGMLNTLFNKPPINYVEDVGLLDRECYIIGGNYADKDDFLTMSNYETKVIVSPYDSINFGTNIPNIYAMKSNSVDVQLSSPINNNILEEIKLATALNRSLLSDCEVLPFNEVLELVISKKERIIVKENYERIKQKCIKIMEKIKEKI